MCGLIGFIDYSKYGFYKKDAEMFFSSLLLNSLRGVDSTGILGVRSSDDKVEYLKTLGDPYNLYNSSKYKMFEDRIITSYNALLGHGRFATKGEVKIGNAHPFIRGHISLIHNGTLTNWEEVKKRLFKNPEVFKVDSDLCAAIIAMYDVDTLLKEISGAYAFIYYDEQEKIINVVRNNERPLFLFKRTDREQYILASDEHIFAWLKSKYDIRGDSYIISPYNIYSFSREEKDYNIKSFTPKYTHYYNNYHENGYDSLDNHYVPETRKIPLLEPPKDNNIKEKKKNIEENKGDVNVLFTLYSKINFKINKIEDRSDENTLSEHYFVKGFLLSDPDIDVVGSIHGNLGEIKEKDICNGTIFTIIPKESENNCRLWVSHIKKIAPGDSKNNDNIVLFNKRSISRTEYLNLAKLGCAGEIKADGKRQGCDSVITMEMAGFVSEREGLLYCPKCTTMENYSGNILH